MEREVEATESDSELVACLVAPMSDAKELLAACEEAAIDAQLARDACCGKGGCGCAPKMQLLVAPADVPRVASLIKDRWNVMLEREGVDPDASVAAPVGEGEHAPCPACGTAAPLVEGACSDCGLQLE